jgi:hypothetical protein
MATVPLKRTPENVTNIDGSLYVQPLAARAWSGVYTLTYDSGVHYATYDRTPAVGNDGFVVTIPDAEVRTTTNRGKKITSFDVIYKIETAILGDVQLAFYRVSPPVHGAAQTATALTFTYDAEHTDAAHRNDVDSHTMNCLVDTGGVWLNSGEGLFAEVSITGEGTATSVFKFFGIKVNYTSDEG